MINKEMNTTDLATVTGGGWKTNLAIGGLMIKVCYSELDGPKGLSLRLEAAGHAGYAPAGQDVT